MELTQTERTILIHLLQEGNDVAANIGEVDSEEKPHPESVRRSFYSLEEKGLIENIGSGVRRLTPHGITAARSVR